MEGGRLDRQGYRVPWVAQTVLLWSLVCLEQLVWNRRREVTETGRWAEAPGSTPAFAQSGREPLGGVGQRNVSYLTF